MSPPGRPKGETLARSAKVVQQCPPGRPKVVQQCPPSRPKVIR